MKLRTVLVDDEPLALMRLRRLLESELDITISAECTSGRAALAAFREHRPDLVFLDIEMPLMNGFEVLNAARAEKDLPLPAVIFQTAYPEFSLRAFDVAAHDYLLKPTSRERLQASLDRVRARLGFRVEPTEPEQVAAAPLRKLTVRNGERILFVSVDSIDWIEAASNYVILHVGEAREIMRETLGNLEKRLPEDQFLRISRSALVRLGFVRGLRLTAEGEHLAVMASGAELIVTRHLRELGQRVSYA